MQRSHTEEHIFPMRVLRDEPLTDCCAFEQVVVLYESSLALVAKCMVGHLGISGQGQWIKP